MVLISRAITLTRALSPNTSPVYLRSRTRYPPAKRTLPGADTATAGFDAAAIALHAHGPEN